MTTSSATMSEPSDCLDSAYIHHLQCSRQWRGFLAALGQEFISALAQQELTALMARIGARFAVEHPLPASDTVQGLQDAMNRVWGALDWGIAQLKQSQAGMEILHRFSPLTAAFGEQHAPWAMGFLQGAYQQWFDGAGGAGLRVELGAATDALGSVRLCLTAA